MARRVTIKDVARAAGIAPATASHALNRNGTVSRATADFVQRIADDLGYSRDERAVSLRRQRTSTIGLLISRMSDPYHADLAEALETAVRERGFSIVAGVTNRDPDLERHYIDLFLGQRCAGVIIIQAREVPCAFIRAEVPMVIVNAHGGPNFAVPIVEVMDLEGMQAVVAHLIGLGHRRIALVGYPDASTRTDGYCQALKDADIPLDDDLILVLETVHGHTSVCDPVCRFLRQHPDVTAVAAATDITALGVLRAAHILGRQVPDDLAVTGFDGIGLGALVVPTLTTAAQPYGLMARAAMDSLVDQIAKGGGSQPFSHVQLETTLVIRESSGVSRLPCAT